MGGIKAFYRRNCIQYMIFGYIRGARKVNPDISLEEISLKLQRDFADGNEDEMSLASITKTYNRMNKEYWEAEKNAGA